MNVRIVICMTEDQQPFIKKEVTVLKCLKCGYEWQQRFEGKLPGTCPKPGCRSPNWMKPKGYRKPFTWKNPETKNSNRKRKTQSS